MGNKEEYNKAYKKKYCKAYCLSFSSLNEPELIEHLERQPNKNGYIKMLIRRDMAMKKTGKP